MIKRPRYRLIRCLLLAVALLSLPAAAQASESEQRDAFERAHDELRHGRSLDMDRLRQRLGDYPLWPYLESAALVGRIDELAPERARQFLERHDGPVAWRFRGRWLDELAERRAWAQYHAFDTGAGGARRQCLSLRARRAVSGVDGDWLDAARDLWVVGSSQPDACNPVFAELYQRNALTAEQRWQRVERSLRNGERELARWLRPRLVPADRRWLDHWLDVTERPRAALRNPGFDTASERGAELVTYGVRRVAAQDREAAAGLLETFASDGSLEDAQVARLHRAIALQAAYSRDADADERLRALPDPVVDDHVREWRARVAVGQQDWERVRAAVADLPDELRREAEWRYWRAQALRRTGHAGLARAILAEIAERRSYYGFLAADALGRPYAMNHDSPRVEPERREALLAKPGIRRARELLALDMRPQARSEWIHALRGVDQPTRVQAALIAADWGWYNRAIHTANAAGLRDALDLRFPTGYGETITAAAQEAGVDPALALAIARKESAFSQDARSSAGALGLLQVMPRTGGRIAREVGVAYSGSYSLLDPEINARVGTAYLSRMLARFAGDVVLAAAAYNAGPTRAQQWIEENAGQPAAIWIE
ncbi:MAG: transglycosylase SLT domain-containing protein, partial [Ectothiorhodospiraceae bacterium]